MWTCRRDLRRARHHTSDAKITNVCLKDFFRIVKVENDQIVPAKIFPPFVRQLATPNEHRGETRIIQAANVVDVDRLNCERGNRFVCQHVYLRFWKGIAQCVNCRQSQDEIAKSSAAGDQETPAVNMKLTQAR